MREAEADWVQQAACTDMDPDLFFPPRGGDSGTTTRVAKQVCAACPVRVQCLEYALANSEQWGVWGGLGERERRRLAAQRRRARSAA